LDTAQFPLFCLSLVLTSGGSEKQPYSFSTVVTRRTTFSCVSFGFYLNNLGPCHRATTWLSSGPFTADSVTIMREHSAPVSITGFKPSVIAANHSEAFAR
jgi:hypothetical protein